MHDQTTHELDCTDRVWKRAQWEDFRFAILGDDQIEVTNNSYHDDARADHTYIVRLEGGEPVECTCPYAEYHDDLCKHQVSITLAEPVIAAVLDSERTPLVTDGGQLVAETDEDSCPNGDKHCAGPDGNDLPCFPCFTDLAREA